VVIAQERVELALDVDARPLLQLQQAQAVGVGDPPGLGEAVREQQVDGQDGHGDGELVEP
jgi:hypothetical protein